MSTSLAAQVASSADRHAAILRELSELDYAPSALPGAENYARDLGALVREAEANVKDARKKVAKERKEHVEIKDAGFKKFTYKIVGKGDDFKKKVSKEEQEFLQAQQNLQKEEHALEGLKRNAKDADENLTKIKSAVARREQLQRQLDELYARVFDGPTPDARRDDDLEASLKTAIMLNDEKQGALNYAGQTVAILGLARESIAEVVKHLQQARAHSTMDVWGGGVGSDIMEMNALHSADMAASVFKNAITQARHFNPAVSNIQPPKIPKASAMDVMFDNVFTDLAQHDKIKAAQRDAAKTVDTLKREIAKMEERVNAAAVEAAMSSSAVIQARKELHDFRARTFEEVLNASSGVPPTYSGSLIASPSDDLPPAGFRGGVDEGHVGGFRPPNVGAQLFSPPSGPPPSTGQFLPPTGPRPTSQFSPPAGAPTTRQFAPPSEPPPSGQFSHPAGAPPIGQFSPPADPAPATSSPFGFPSFSTESSHSVPGAPSFPAFPAGPSNSITAAGPSSTSSAPSWPTFSTQPDSDHPPPPPPKWGSMNPYAAYLTRKGTADDLWWERHTPPPESTTPKPEASAGVSLPAGPAPDAAAAQSSSSAAPANVHPAPTQSTA